MSVAKKVKEEVVMVRISELMLHPELIEMRKINPIIISEYRQQMRMGSEFPPLVVDEETQYAISGSHRLTAYQEEFPEDTEVPVIYRTFATEADMLCCAVEENLKNGLRMDGFTKRKFARAMLDADMSRKEVARTFNVPERKIEQWGQLSVVIINEGKPTGRKETKGGLGEHVTTMTEAQYKEHVDFDRGFPHGMVGVMNQLIRHLNNGYIDVNLKKNREPLEALYDALVYAGVGNGN